MLQFNDNENINKKSTFERGRTRAVRGIIIGLSIAVLLFFVTIPIWPLLYMGMFNIYNYFRHGLSDPSFWINMSIFLLIVALFAILIIIILPFLIFLVKRIYTYVSLLFISLSKGYKIKMQRFPFSSLKGISSKEDISINTENGEVCLHFLDIIFPSKRAVTVPNDSEYAITPAYGKTVSKFAVVRGDVASYGQSGTEGRGQKFGVLMSSGHVLAKNKDRIRSIPAVNIESQKHILIIQSVPVEMKKMKNGELVSLGNGESVGDFTFYDMNCFKRKLIDNFVF